MDLLTAMDCPENQIFDHFGFESSVRICSTILTIGETRLEGTSLEPVCCPSFSLPLHSNIVICINILSVVVVVFIDLNTSLI